jgi:putative flavoprotein involved in K+ transport
MSELLDAVIVGAGQGGLAASYFLQRDGLRHVVLERGRIGETWLSQRWDTFQLNTPNFMNVLPGLPYRGNQTDGFWRQDELVAYFQEYAGHFQLPVRTGVEVLSLERAEGDGYFIIQASAEGGPDETLLSRSVIVASGIQRTPKIPSLHSKIPAGITELHTAAYRNPGALPPGAVLVVGSAQSGCQIAEDLLSAGRRVYLCTGKVGRIPRRYRGRDSLEWWIDMGLWEITYASLEDKSISLLPVPQISGVGRYGRSLSLQSLARQGAVILGRLEDVDGGVVILGGDAAANVMHADEFSQRFKDGVDAYLEKSGLEASLLEEDPGDAPDSKAACASPLRRLDLREVDIRTVIWATGFTGDFRWIHLPVFDADGAPIQERGISPVPGLFFIGFPWLSKRKSGIIYGIAEDAEYIVDVLARQSATAGR